MSQENVELVRSIIQSWERGDWSRRLGAPRDRDGDQRTGRHPQLDGLGRDRQRWREFLSTWEEFRVEADEYRALDDEPR